jgi:protein ImuB
MLNARWSGSQRKEARSSSADDQNGIRNTLPLRRSALWYALSFPQLTEPISAFHRQQHLNALAAVCQQFSDLVSLDPPDALLFEVRGSLRYFGGIESIRRGLNCALGQQLQQWQWHEVFYQSVSPAPAASLLLARSGHNLLLYTDTSLRSALGHIPVDLLPIDTRTGTRLKKCGLLLLRDLWRLPTAQLRLRFGKPLAACLDELLNRRPQTRLRWQAAPVFCEQIDCEDGLSSVPPLLYLCEELLARLEHFLRRHHLCTDQIIISCLTEHSETRQILIRTRKPVREKALFNGLLTEKLGDFTVQQPITGVRLEVSRFSAYVPEGVRGTSGINAAQPYSHSSSQSSSQTPSQTPSQLLDQLSARLGEGSVLRFVMHEEYTPEFAGCYVDYLSVDEKLSVLNPLQLMEKHATDYTRTLPCWLLQPPVALFKKNRKLFYLSPLEMVSGPQRIETRWWAGRDIRRDYYIACNQQGIYTWIYKDLNPADHPPGQRWFLHGLFG